MRTVIVAAVVAVLASAGHAQAATIDDGGYSQRYHVRQQVARWLDRHSPQPMWLADCRIRDHTHAVCYAYTDDGGFARIGVVTRPRLYVRHIQVIYS